MGKLKRFGIYMGILAAGLVTNFIFAGLTVWAFIKFRGAPAPDWILFVYFFVGFGWMIFIRLKLGTCREFMEDE